MSVFGKKIGVFGHFMMFLAVLTSFSVLGLPAKASEKGTGIIRGIAVDENGVRLTNALVTLKMENLQKSFPFFNQSPAKPKQYSSEYDFEWIGLEAGVYRLRGMGEEIEPVTVELKEGQMTQEDVVVPTCREEDLTCRIQSAIIENQVDQVRELLAAGADPNRASHWSHPLILASEHANLEVVQMLVEAGANVNLPAEPFYRKHRPIPPLRGLAISLTPYENALWSGHTDVAAYLLEQGATTNDLLLPPPGAIRGSIVDEKGNPVEGLTVQLSYGFDENFMTIRRCKTDSDGTYFLPSIPPDEYRILIEGPTPPLTMAVSIPEESPLQELPHIRLSSTGILNQKLLLFPALSPHLKELKELLEKGANVNCADQEGTTPLIRRAEFGNLGAVQVLVEAGAHLNTINAKGLTAIDVATQRDHPAIIAYLLEKGAVPSDLPPAPRGRIGGILLDENRKPLALTPIHYQKKNDEWPGFTTEITHPNGRFLFSRLKPGSYRVGVLHQTNGIRAVTLTNRNAAVTNLTLRCPRQIALNQALLRDIKHGGRNHSSLLEQGADPNARDPRTDKTPLSLLMTMPQMETARALLEAGADIQATNKQGQTLLMVAAENEALEMVQILLKAKADVNQTDQLQRSALLYACKEGDLEIATMLIDAGAKLDATDRENRTPLDAAVWENHTELAEKLRSLDAPGTFTHSKPMGAIRGTAHNEDGTPLRNIMLYCKSTNPDASYYRIRRTWKNGRFSFEGMKAGTYAICLSEQTNNYQTVTLTNRNHMLEDVEIRLSTLKTEELNAFSSKKEAKKASKSQK